MLNAAHLGILFYKSTKHAQKRERRVYNKLVNMIMHGHPTSNIQWTFRKQVDGLSMHVHSVLAWQHLKIRRNLGEVQKFSRFLKRKKLLPCSTWTPNVYYIWTFSHKLWTTYFLELWAASVHNHQWYDLENMDSNKFSGHWVKCVIKYQGLDKLGTKYVENGMKNKWNGTKVIGVSALKYKGLLIIRMLVIKWDLKNEMQFLDNPIPVGEKSTFWTIPMKTMWIGLNPF